MLVSEAITEIRNKTNDRDSVGLDDSEILSYLNEAIQYVSSLLIKYNCTDLVKEVKITTSTYNLPANFAKTCGMYPVKRTGTTLKLLDRPPLTIRYFATYEPVTSSGTMPFNHIGVTQVAIKVACLYANAQQKLDISADASLEQELANAIAASMGVEG